MQVPRTWSTHLFSHVKNVVFVMTPFIPGVPENMIHFEKIIAFDSIEINS